MTEHDHDHDPDAAHGHDHGHGHSHGPPPVKDLFTGPPMDAASASLARALRMSFRLLLVIMIFVFIGFLFSGMTTINSDEKGVVTFFGRQVAVVGPGLHFTWPYPVGSVQKVSTAKQSIMVEFWPYLSPEDLSKHDLSKVITGERGLRPGVDSALLTGDAYLFHTQIQCMYEIDEPVAYLSGIADPNGFGQDKVTGLAVNTAVTCAAVRAAAQRTADGLMGSEQRLFVAQVQQEAQELLRKMGAGVRITGLNVVDRTWPLRARPDFLAAQSAGTLRSKAIEGAIGEARNRVSHVAGEINSRKLVGEPWKEAEANQAPRPPGEDYDLIGQYEIARADPNATPEQSEALLARIDEILLSQSTQGEVTTILREATSYRDAQIAMASSRAANFEKLLAAYRRDPAFFLQQKWSEMREEVLQSDTVIKWILNPSQAKTVILINTPPEISKEIDTKWLQAQPPPR